MLYSKMAGAISLVRVARCNGARLYVLSQGRLKNSNVLRGTTNAFQILGLVPTKYKASEARHTLLVTECIWSLVEGDHFFPKHSDLTLWYW